MRGPIVTSPPVTSPIPEPARDYKPEDERICTLTCTQAGYVVKYYNPVHREDEVTTFDGPEALDRAIAFAGGQWYDGWRDPDALAGY